MTAVALALSLWIHAVPALKIDDAQARRAVLLEQLRVEEHDTQLWYWGWGAFWVASTAGQFATWPITAPADRTSLIVWGIASGAGAVVTLALRPTALGAYKRASAPGADVEKIWVDVHDDEVFNHSIWEHLGCVVLNAIPFTILGLAYHRWDWAFFAIGIALSEAQLATFPQLLRVTGVR